MTPAVEIQLIAATVAVACAIPGVFLVLRRMALMSDAIGHAILLGIVLGFFLVEDIDSPALVLGAALVGVLTVLLVELVHSTRLVREDAAIGIVFPALFSIGVLLISRFAGNVHLDVDAVLLGELAFAPFRRLTISGVDVGPKSLWLMLAILAVNVLFVTAFFKELKLSTFDPGLAAALGFAPGVLHYAFMSLVSVTAVGAFDAVGAVLVVALMIAPPATAYLLTSRLTLMIVLSACIGILSAIAGYWAAHFLDVSIAGAMATAAGVAFGVAFLFAPDRGLVAIARRRHRQRYGFAQTMLTIHLLHHEGQPDELVECRVAHLSEHLRWPDAFATRVVELAERSGLVQDRGDGTLSLTTSGRHRAQEAMVR